MALAPQFTVHGLAPRFTVHGLAPRFTIHGLAPTGIGTPRHGLAPRESALGGTQVVQLRRPTCSIGMHES